MDRILPGNKKGQQLIMPMARLEDSPEILDGYSLHAIDLRSDWPNILQTILNNKLIQEAMENSYQDFLEGFKLSDFKHHNGIKGTWSFQDIDEGIYPYIITTTEWVLEFEEKEWNVQATDTELRLKNTIQTAIQECNCIDGYKHILSGLEQSLNNLLSKYLPRPNQPESWRPQNASHWSSHWMKILAEIHYSELSNDWRLIANNTHSVVAGFGDNNTIFLIDIILLTTDADEIINKLREQ